MPESVLDSIIDEKRREVERSRKRLPLETLRTLLHRSEAPRGFKQSLIEREAPRIISEVKRASPSKGVLRPASGPFDWEPERLAQEYESGGAAALSVLTDIRYFWGQPDLVTSCRQATWLPALRKDFIVELYQVDESRWLGADCILLMARCLTEEKLHELANRAFELGMDVLLEVHEETELNRALTVEGAIIGVNHRNLSSLEMDPNRAIELRQRIPSDRIMVAESGIDSPKAIRRLMDNGIENFLVGGHLASSSHPRFELEKLRAI